MMLIYLFAFSGSLIDLKEMWDLETLSLTFKINIKNFGKSPLNSIKGFTKIPSFRDFQNNDHSNPFIRLV